MQQFVNITAKVLQWDWLINLVIGILLFTSVTNASSTIFSGSAFVIFGVLLLAEAALKFIITFIVKPV